MKKKRQVGVIAVQDVQLPEVVPVIARQNGKEGVQEVVALFIKTGVDSREDLESLGNGFVKAIPSAVIEDHGQ